MEGEVVVGVEVDVEEGAQAGTQVVGCGCGEIETGEMGLVKGPGTRK